MWRVPGFVGRVLTRCHGNAPLRLTPPPHQDEVSSPTVLVPTSSQRGDDGQKKKQRRFQFCNAEIPRYTALDAVGWGAAAVIFMHMCRRIHSSFSAGGEVVPLGVSSSSSPSSSSSSSLLQRCGYRLLLDTFCRRDVLPGGRTVLCLEGAAESQNIPYSSSSGQQGAEQTTEELSACDWTNRDGIETSDWTNRDSRETSDWTNRDSRETSDWTDRETTQDYDEGAVEEAAVNLSHVGDSSVPVVLNIIGLQSVQCGDDEAAFSCFHTGALQGYRKAQFNTAVCYETGRGTTQNHHKALYFYRQAANGNHHQAQYRYAKLLLGSRGRQRSTEELQYAVSMLEKASLSGLTEAQLFLASVLSEEPIRDARRSVIYLQMAAEQGSSRAQLILGQCYERGVGVEQSLQTALRLYHQAATGGSQRAKTLLMSAGTREAALRSIRSAPCFQRAVQPGSLTTSLPVTTSLPHSWSTGNLPGNLYPYAPPPCSDITLGVG